jgi:hypothetical protein
VRERVAQARARMVVHIGRQVVVRARDLPAQHLVVQARAGLEREAVERDVLGLERQRAFEGVLPGGQGLVGQAEDQVDVDAVAR